MQHERRAVPVEEAAGLPLLEGHAPRQELDLQLPVGGNDHVREIADVGALRVLEAVRRLLRIEVAARRREWRGALALLVDVEAMLAGRHVVERRGHEHAVWRLCEGGLADGLAGGGLELHSKGRRRG